MPRSTLWLGVCMSLMLISVFMTRIMPVNAWREDDILDIENLVKKIENVEHYSKEKNAANFLQQFNEELTTHTQTETLASWAYLTDMTPENGKKESKVETTTMTWMISQVTEAKKYLLHITKFSDESTERMLKLIPAGTAISKDPQVNKKFNDLKSKLQEIYGTTKVKGKTLDEMDHDLRNPSKTAEEKLEIWKDWRDAVGPQIRPIYIEFLKNAKIVATDSGYSDFGAAWRELDFGYETENVEELSQQLYDAIRPLYEQLHAYVRRKLIIRYPEVDIDPEGPIPAHLLGNMWAQEWDIFDLAAPYPNAGVVGITEELKKQNYTPNKMFETAEDFFTSLGLDPMTNIFWDKSMITRPDGRQVECHASAEDFFVDNDFRIKMCTNIDQQDFVTIHHEMGHIQYFMQYAHQPAIFRSGACAAFHEAIGDTISLAVQTTNHMKSIGLLPKKQAQSREKDVTETDLNYLMSIALQKIAFLPYGFLIDKYRWQVFSGDVDEGNLTSAYWKLREEIQGIKSPISRTEKDFDPGAKYHVAGNVAYIRYFFSHIAQYQFYSAMCKASGHTGALHKCDFYKSKSAGTLLKSMLSLGQSKEWPDAMEIMTGQRTFSIEPLKEYFKPLLDWLKEQNQNEYIGWKI